ncbi:hypothetical protein FRC10_001008, partial [Ceratobasidium sp. 414]
MAAISAEGYPNPTLSSEFHLVWLVSSLRSRIFGTMPSRRPSSILELAAHVRPTGYDSLKSSKDVLRIATAERDSGNQAKSQGDLESAFIHFGKAATLIFEEFPTHPGYDGLTPVQKHALAKIRHGRIILDLMSEIKPALSKRLFDWYARHPDADLSVAIPSYQPTRHLGQPPELLDSRGGGGRAEPTRDSGRRVSQPEGASPVSSSPHDRTANIIAHKQQGIGRQMQEDISPRE